MCTHMRKQQAAYCPLREVLSCRGIGNIFKSLAIRDRSAQWESTSPGLCILHNIKRRVPCERSNQLSKHEATQCSPPPPRAPPIDGRAAFFSCSRKVPTSNISTCYFCWASFHRKQNRSCSSEAPAMSIPYKSRDRPNAFRLQRG